MADQIKKNSKVQSESAPKAEEARSRRDDGAVVAFNPFTKEKDQKVHFDSDKLKSLTNLGKGKILEAGDNARRTLADPSSVFEGFIWEKDHPPRGEGWLCYVSRPQKCYEDDGSDFPAPPDEVFLVFVEKEWIVYNWYWVECDPTDKSLPINHGTRFKRRIH